MSGVHPGRLTTVLERIGPLDERATAEASSHLDRLTKPHGSLGRLEELMIQVAGISGERAPRLDRRTIVVIAADHGVAVRGVSAYPAAVTAQMVTNFLAGGAAVNALARLAAADLLVIDAGVATPIASPTHVVGADGARLVSAPIRSGSRDLSVEPALTHEETLRAIDLGLDTAATLIADGTTIVAVGEMGIGNTTAASALVAALTGRPVRMVTGRGTGVDAEEFELKVRLIESALAQRPPDRGDPIDILASFGGLEIAAMAGLILGAAAGRLPVILDGLISGVAALVAARLSPNLPGRLVAGHRSPEPGHDVVINALGLQPLLDLGMRLGEGSGAALAMLLVEAAVRTRDEMATFDQAGLTQR